MEAEVPEGVLPALAGAHRPEGDADAARHGTSSTRPSSNPSSSSPGVRGSTSGGDPSEPTTAAGPASHTSATETASTPRRRSQHSERVAYKPPAPNSASPRSSWDIEGPAGSRKSFSSDEFKGGEPETAGTPAESAPAAAAAGSAAEGGEPESAGTLAEAQPATAAAGSTVEATAEASPFDISLLVSRRARLAAALARAGVEDSAVAAVLAGGRAATPEDLGL